MVIYWLPKPTQRRSLIWGIWVVAWATGWLLRLTAILVCLLNVLLVQSVSWSCIPPRTIEEWTYLLTYLHHYTQAKWRLQYLVDCCYWWPTGGLFDKRHAIMWTLLKCPLLSLVITSLQLVLILNSKVASNE